MSEMADLPLLADTKICFCTLCSHQPDYGYCYGCPCHNHQSKPEQDDSSKLIKTVDHIRKLMVYIVGDNTQLRQQVEQLKLQRSSEIDLLNTELRGNYGSTSQVKSVSTDLRPAIQALVDGAKYSERFQVKSELKQANRERDLAQAGYVEMATFIQRRIVNLDVLQVGPKLIVDAKNLLKDNPGQPLLDRLAALELCYVALLKCARYRGGNLPAEMIRQAEQALAAVPKEEK